MLVGTGLIQTDLYHLINMKQKYKIIENISDTSYQCLKNTQNFFFMPGTLIIKKRNERGSSLLLNHNININKV